MKVLFIGGTGLISSACSELAVKRGFDLFILNRGFTQKYPIPMGAHLVIGDVRGDTNSLEELVKKYKFDSVVDWIAYTPEDIERDIQIFSGRIKQFIFISSASAYQKPPSHYLITERTPLQNPFWEYSRKKIACEEKLKKEYNKKGFPVTIVRPSLTYGLSQIPLCVNSWQHPYTVIDRMKKGKKVIVTGDGTSLWVLTWNEDFARGFVGLLGREDTVGEDFHITSDEVLTWDQIYRQTAAALGVDAHIVHIPAELIAAYVPGALGSLIGDKAHSAVFDNTKIKQYVPEFSCSVPWEEGVRRAIAWHEADSSRQTVDEELSRVWDKILDAYLPVFPIAGN